MANSEDCASRGSSGWDITFTPDGEYWLTKHGQTHVFPDHDSVRNFLMGYEIAHDVYNVEAESARHVTINWDGHECKRDSIDEILDEVYERSKDGRCIGGLEISVDTSELDAALKSARELADIMKSCGLGGA